MLGKAPSDAAGGVIDLRDQMTGRTAIFQPAIGRAVLDHQFAEAGPPLAPHMHGFHPLSARTPQFGLAHPLPQRLAAHRQTVFSQMLGSQRRPEIAVALPHPRQNSLRQTRRQLAIRAAPAQSVYQRAIPFLTQARQQAADLAVGQIQPPTGFDLRQMALLHVVQHFQTVPLGLAQGNSLRFHRTPPT